METKVSLFNLILTALGLVGMVIASWVHMRVTIAKLDTQLIQARKDIDEEKIANKSNFNKLFDKIDELKDLIIDKR
jgi:hypothetical protein